MSEPPQENTRGDMTTDRTSSLEMQGNIFAPFSTDNFVGLFSGIGNLHYPTVDQNQSYPEPTKQNNKFGESPDSFTSSGAPAADNSQLWGASLDNRFAGLSMEPSDRSQNTTTFTPERRNEEGLGLFQNPLSMRNSSVPYNPLWGTDNDPPTVSHNPYIWGNDSDPAPTNGGFGQYSPSDGALGSPFLSNNSRNGTNSEAVSPNNGFSSPASFVGLGNPMYTRPANPALYSPYTSPTPSTGSQRPGFVANDSRVFPAEINSPTSPNERTPQIPDDFLSNGHHVEEDSDSHSVSPVGQSYPANNSSAQVCRYFSNGNCMRGDRCNYLHMRSDQNGARKDDKKKEKLKRMGNTGNQKANSRRRGNIPHAVETKKTAIDVSRFTSIDQVIGQVYRICKDQHGCRFLQKKLEEKDQNPKAVDIIFDEVYDYMVELMTDPFGNYLCQKLIEHCSQQQQLLIVQKVAPHLVAISKNMHGTRAVQKMIECLCTPPQIQLVVNSLRSSVVPLIKDLNGNHVIQRCLHELSYQNKQFVYDAVAANCVEVATHRHGCCVMQRCIDSASEEQKLQLVRQISSNVLLLVQDQFGNYVVQYVLDLPFVTVKVNLIQEFLGNLSSLSMQKFSSNVIEKCLRVADEKVKVQLIDELMESQSLMALLQDAYGNYVIQTALSQAQPQQRANLEEKIRPLLPALRNTNYGKRIQNKISFDI